MESEPAQFLDVPTLLERSEPVSRASWTWYAAGGLLVLGIIGGVGGTDPTAGQMIVQMTSALLMLGLVAGSGMLIWGKLKKFRAEREALREVEELIQLRRWGEAAAALDAMLSRPMRAATSRVQALVYLASVLSRYHRFEDALALQEYLLKHVQFDRAGEFGLKLNRAMAMVREDHLVDAHRAIGELRKLTGGAESGGLALVEIYRDVKTGHAVEAIEIFDKRLKAMREQLGQRLADAYALVAAAYEFVGRGDEAAGAWANATVLAPVGELLRRYPDVGAVANKYPASVMPAGMGA